MFKDGFMRAALLVTVAFAATLFVACGGDDDDDHEMDDSTNMSESMDMDHEDPFAFGHPGDPADVDRTIEIEATDLLKFEPDMVSVKVGETITFRVHNAGANKHEFILGTADEQADHEQEMQAMAASGEMHMGDEANAIDLPAGETKEITWTFTEAGEMIFGCHEPAHYDAGMQGMITVS